MYGSFLFTLFFLYKKIKEASKVYIQVFLFSDNKGCISLETDTFCPREGQNSPWLENQF